MRAEIEIDGTEVNLAIKEGVKEYLSNNGLMRLIRKEVKGEVNNQAKRKLTKSMQEQIRDIRYRLDKLEAKDEANTRE